ncbi:MAG: YkgJ family cysteine cluster protein [Desulfosudis oleivorans]|nr:YkgJ family cysteine cluster protein [Desulfosudis oleivorans]
MRFHRQHDRPLRHEPLRQPLLPLALHPEGQLMDPALRASFLERLRRIYAAMDAAYAPGRRRLRLRLRRAATRLLPHAVSPPHPAGVSLYLREGFSGLPAERRERIREDGRRGRRAARPGDLAAGTDTKPMCPLNESGRCGLYAHRPMICRLHGIPHELHPPGRAGAARAGMRRVSSALRPRRLSSPRPHAALHRVGAARGGVPAGPGAAPEDPDDHRRNAAGRRGAFVKELDAEDLDRLPGIAHPARESHSVPLPSGDRLLQPLLPQPEPVPLPV